MSDQQAGVIARRFPAHQGYATKWDVPTGDDITAYAFGAYRDGWLALATLARIMADLADYENTALYNAMRPYDRAVLISDVMSHRAFLIALEFRRRRLGR